MKLLNVDILALIFNGLKVNKNVLHSSLLVNRVWCHLVVPILWKNHTSGGFWHDLDEKSQKMLFNIILSLLPSSSKQLLSDNGIKLPLTVLIKPPSFNYIRFCKFPEHQIIKDSIRMVARDLDNSKKNLLEQEVYRLFVSQTNNIRKLYWSTLQPLSLFPGSSTCFSQLYHLSIDISIVSSNAINEMAQICRGLNKLSICNCSQDLPELISLIDAQRNLKSVTFFNLIKKGSCEELVKALTRKRNTINELYLEVFNTMLPLLLTSLINLEGLTIHCVKKHEIIGDEIKENLATWELPVLQNICIIGLSCFKELAMLIENIKGNITRVNIITYTAAENTGMLIKAIANNCPNIKELYAYIIPNDFIHIKSLLINCRSLVEIRFGMLNFFANENLGDEFLDILAKFSPNSLIDIAIYGNCKCSNGAFEQLLESYRERSKFNFWVCNNYYITESHILIVRKYIEEGVINWSNLVQKEED